MKKIMVSLVLLLLTASCAVAPNSLTSKSNAASGEIKEVGETGVSLSTSKLPLGELNWSNYDFPFPKPKASRFAVEASTEKVMMCYGMHVEDYADYKAALVKDNWQLVFSDSEGRNTPDDAVYYTYIKGNLTLSIINQTFVEEDGGNHIRIQFRSGLDETVRDGRMDKPAALSLIQSAIELERPGDYEEGKNVEYIVEMAIPDAFEKANIQIFTAYGDNINFGEFIIANETVMRVFDNFSDVCVADIDKDGYYELISLYEFGSGMRSIALNAYKVAPPSEFSYKYGYSPDYARANEKSLEEAYSTGYAPMEGFKGSIVFIAYRNVWSANDLGGLTLEKLSETQVGLYGRSLSETGELVPDEYYGLLQFDGTTLVPEKTEDFLFDSILR
jgi:hypothetical protein